MESEEHIPANLCSRDLFLSLKTPFLSLSNLVTRWGKGPQSVIRWGKDHSL